jgi:trimethylamine--corrinoid protein Co-methyltransferase
VQLGLTVIDDAERDLIIDSALRILQRVGMRMKAPPVMGLMKDAGADVDRDAGVVHMSEDLVRSALATLPERLLIAGAAPELDRVLDRRSGPFFNPAGYMAKTLDHRTGAVRPSTLRDVREGSLVMDATPEIDLMWTFATANDVPAEQRQLREYHAYLTHTSKPLVLVDRPTDFGAVTSIMDVLGDGLEGFRRRPRLGLLCAARAPLGVNGALMDAACEFARLGGPIWAFTMPMAGATSPVTLAGTLAVMWAEMLGMVTVIQTAAPGAAILACCGPGILDMRAASMSLGSVENTLLGAASVTIGHHLGLPVHNSALASDAKHPGVQAGYEKGLKAVTAALAGADQLGGGFGALESSSLFHLPMVPIDAEIAAMVRRLAGHTRIDDETIMTAAIERVGVGGSYLKERITRDRVRAGEHFYPSIGSRLSYDQWIAEGRMEPDVARDKVEEILAAHDAQPDPTAVSRLSDAQLTALADICDVKD